LILHAWRIVKGKHAATAFDGEGARLHGGRWNSIGIRVVYVSGSKSLAALETLVHLEMPVISCFVAIPVEFQSNLIETLSPNRLPTDWNTEPASPAAQHIGDSWVKSCRSAILAVPSILTGETNYLLNPAHPNFKKIRTGKPQPFTFDPRLLT
jgi:RES domain-containing protein